MDMTGKDMVINRKDMARKKLAKLKAGQSAFTETKEVAELLRKLAKEEGVSYEEDVTELGAWFIPQK
ncbi:hypothetical protein [Alkalicoccobacillus porphyridii]|uniref:Uncharacterized protein n=1 Tax=Alkalicoccobacillus porphyridii TaxID=2597270 RepID=A0A554A302_9BACI|nr:hypothetical protein [Alkalicoccobacillus porphyridii]TSB48045.1 hypothetical protein FN960_00365 [Alkalicoccobacillus porphyridii]